jgi:hypothetical protein
MPTLPAVTIAAGPDPAAALLDLAVLATLNRMVWQDYWQPKVFGQPATIMVSAFKEVEDDIFSIAGKVLTTGQLRELRDLIAEWHDQHPDQVAVDFIRFSDFGGLGRKPELSKIKAPGGLLAPVKEAAQAADEIRLTSERAMFLFIKLQQTMTSSERVIGQTEAVGQVFLELVGAVDKLSARIESRMNGYPGKPFDVKEYIPALEKLNQTVRDATILIGTVDQTSAPLVWQLVTEINYGRDLCAGKKRALAVGKTKRGKGTKIMTISDAAGKLKDCLPGCKISDD